MKFFETDVLVIGGGGAGAMATLHAHNQGTKALLVVKGKFGRTGGTTCAMGAATAVGPWHEPEDSQQVHFEDTVKGGSYLNEQNLVRILVEDSPKRVLELERLGAFWERTEEGNRYLLRIDGGHSYPRSVYLEDRPGREMLRAMGSEILRRKIPIVEDTMVLRLLMDDDQAAGAVGVNLFTAEMVGFKANAIVLATGGAGNIYTFTTNPADVTGDGYILALGAGAELVDMEFVQFYPLGLIFPESLKGMLAGTFYYSRLLNAQGERLMKYYDSRLEMSTRDIIARAIYSEIQKGNGTPRGGVLCDMTYNPPGFIKKQLPALNDFYLKIGIDVEKQMVEVAPTCHFFMGGIRVNEEWRSTIDTLFAAGEAAGGVQGANRLSQNSLADIMVSGGRAGDAAGQEAKRRTSFRKINEAQIEEERKRVEELFARRNNDNLGPRKVKTHLNRLMWDFVGLIRSGEGLKKALADFKRMEEEDLPRITLATPSRRYNREFIETLELSNLLKVAKAVSTPALQRDESRGAHFRQDYPKWDNRNWLKHLRISQKNGTLQLSDGPVNLLEMKPPGD
jgi:succinate dehydrogenase/fumarate reductase flavoprotein subunit